MRFLVLLFPFLALTVARAADDAPPPPALEAAPTTPTPGETMAARELREVMEREQLIWERLRADPENADMKRRSEAEIRDVITAYENIIRANYEFAEAYAAYGLVLSRTGNREAGVKAFLRANKLKPTLPMVKNQLGNFLAEEGNYKEALPYYLAALQLKPDEPLYHYQLGTLLHEFRRLLVADELYADDEIDQLSHDAFRQAAGLAPENWAYVYRYAESFYDAVEPDWPAALATWRKLEARAKPGVEVETIRLHLARVYIEMGGHDDEARALVAEITSPALESNKQTLVEYLTSATKE